MISFSNRNYKERQLDCIFKRNWIELPLFYNNADDEVMRFDFESKSETYCANTIRAVFDDVFFQDSELLVILYGTNSIPAGCGKSKYFSHMRRIFKKYYKSRDEYVFDDDEPYIIAYRTNRKYFDLDKYLADYFCDNPRIDEIFISLKKGVAISLYDCRGMDLVINDPVFCDIMKKKYAEFLIMKDKASLKRDE